MNNFIEFSEGNKTAHAFDHMGELWFRPAEILTHPIDVMDCICHSGEHLYEDPEHRTQPFVRASVIRSVLKEPELSAFNQFVERLMNTEPSNG